MPILFCNVAWMNDYAGRSADDPPLGGGAFPSKQGYCAEECNFVAADDGYVYGASRRLRANWIGRCASRIWVQASTTNLSTGSTSFGRLRRKAKIRAWWSGGIAVRDCIAIASTSRGVTLPPSTTRIRSGRSGLGRSPKMHSCYPRRIGTYDCGVAKGGVARQAGGMRTIRQIDPPEHSSRE